jgi:putative membrane protein
MKINLIALTCASIILGACNNHPGATSESNSADSSSTSMTTAKTDVTQTPAPDTAHISTAGIPDSTFLAKAYNIGTFEIKIAKLANQKSQNAKVKDFANMMIKDHTEMGKNVAALMQKKNYSKPNELPAELKSKWEDLNKLTGKEFDRKYADINAAGHKEAIDMFSAVSNTSNDADVKKLATDAIPKLKAHEEHATMLQAQVSGM